MSPISPLDRRPYTPVGIKITSDSGVIIKCLEEDKSNPVLPEVVLAKSFLSYERFLVWTPITPVVLGGLWLALRFVFWYRPRRSYWNHRRLLRRSQRIGSNRMSIIMKFRSTLFGPMKTLLTFRAYCFGSVCHISFSLWTLRTSSAKMFCLTTREAISFACRWSASIVISLVNSL